MSSRKKRARRSRACLSHFEIRRGSSLCLRLAIADDVLAGVGDELGALFKKIAPSAISTASVAPVAAAPSIVFVTPEAQEVVIPQVHDNDDEAYHAGVRERLAELFGALCDASLDDALEIMREEQARRMVGAN